ncbi:MAG: hypothetical protein RML84_10730 [Anaerolineae bacterium]|nr:hypothetical protein [Thermoflexales bacterium]MDW8293555.1 hypothetical protein [Anaerolineae bacterium]
MTQSEFAKWLESILGDTPLEVLVDPDILEHMDRVQLQAEQAAWSFAREGSRESFEIAVRAMAKTMFAIGYDAGRQQAQIDSLFSSSEDDTRDDRRHRDNDESPRGALPLL